MTRIILVRHGQTEWNRKERFRGRVDVDVNDAGRAQAEACARAIVARWKPAAVYSSPRSRAVHTAEAIARPLGVAVHVEPGLDDLDYGEWHGRTADDARARWPELIEAWFRSPGTVQPPGGETLQALQGRALASLLSLATRHAEATLVAVAHDAVNRALLLAALGAPFDAFFRIGQETSAINVIETNGAVLSVVLANDVRHLG
jgi:broad specificity phosphatase PhoE